MVEVNGYLEKVVTKMEVHENNNTDRRSQLDTDAHRLVLKTTKKSELILYHLNCNI